MRSASLFRSLDRLHLWVSLGTRLIDSRGSNIAFGGHDQAAIGQIYVINLDRWPGRWSRTKRELSRLRDARGASLASLARRFSAVDARYLHTVPDYSDVVVGHYTLGDQLAIEPIPGLSPNDSTRCRRIDMSPQEIAVALSHIGVWRRIADGSAPYVLVLEDDVYFRRRFMPRIDRAWELLLNTQRGTLFDIFYLSFKEVGAQQAAPSATVRRADQGLWQLSGYVLSQRGARRLLELLPSRGPIDLWVNLQFQRLSVFATGRPIIEQRADVPSSNSYSVLPVLTQVGVLTRERPLLAPRPKLRAPVFALGESGRGLSSLATALLTLGYRCCHDLDQLPPGETKALFGRGRRSFDAYANIGSLGAGQIRRLAEMYPEARIIVTAGTSSTIPPDWRGLHEWPRESDEVPRRPARLLVLPDHHPDKWDLLTRFLGTEYPSWPYPVRPELGQRQLQEVRYGRDSRGSRPLKFDRSPWTLSGTKPHAIYVADREAGERSSEEWSGAELLGADWLLRDDTFPSNLAVFRPGNATVREGSVLLELRRERTMVRTYTSAAIANRATQQYGFFEVEMRPTNVSGLITGVFLHRNSPRQEIDLEILGRDTRRLLTNVYFNPGDDGTKLEYGYRGTPVLVDLGFDASDDFHRYSIEWTPRLIRWRVDGHVVHERFIWDPTPIPDLPLEFNVNLWHSRSEGLAGRLAQARLPARTELRCARIGRDVHHVQ